MQNTSQEQIESKVSENLDLTLSAIEDPEPCQRGKVRDIFLTQKEILLIATDRISAFDQVLGTIPMKGALLTEQADIWLKKASLRSLQLI